MITNLGFGALFIAFLAALYGIAAAGYGYWKSRRQIPPGSLQSPPNRRAENGVLLTGETWIESARIAMLLTWPLLSVAALCLITLLLTGDYQVAYVYNVTGNSMPTYLKVTAWWGGQAGSLLFWAWLMSAFASAVTLRRWERDREFLPWVIIVTMTTLAFFLALILFIENPFVRFWQTASGDTITAFLQPMGATALVPADGRGLNPLLRHPGMIIHPPMLYLGFVSFVIPYAFAIAALVTGRTDDRWIRLTRRWTLVAWLFLSLGLVLGMRWAYDVLGWGGYWGWDPVENAALMPWLAGTAFLHSVMIQEKRGLFKRWNMILIVLTYSLVIIGTFLTRSGVLSSVHAFAQSSIGPLFFGFISVMFLISLALILMRWNSLRSEGELTSLLSRETLFLLNNFLFMAILAAVFWGVFFPILSELFTNQQITMGPPYYKQTTGPLFAGLLLLMGIAPLSAWGRSTWKTIGRAIWKPVLISLLVPLGLVIGGMRGPLALLGLWLAAYVGLVTLHEFWRGAMARRRAHGETLPLALWRLAGRNRRRYGGYIIHLGVVLMALGVIGIEMFQTQTQARLAVGQSLTLDGYTLTYNSLAEFTNTDGRSVARAVVTVTKPGAAPVELHPRRDYYPVDQQSMTIPGVRSTLEDDFYVILVDWEPISQGSATFKVYHNPLVNWMWIGAIVFLLGTLVAAWPEAEVVQELSPRERVTAAS
jgi:cytochrome c-type biogenesis protein CcmF